MKDFKKSCIYQIYPRSFKDTNDDGIGDLKGITEKIDYLHELGIDYIWSTPFYISPQHDNGYDVADYKAIDSMYGSMEDFEKLVEEADKKDIGIILDMVFNHTSTEHIWFQKALKGEKKYKDYFIWKDPKADGGIPNNWISKFGGSVWEYVPEFNQYYMHLFDKTQADLNWENPEVRQEIKDILNFWIQKGVKGFRFDVINLISKPDKFDNDYEGDGRRFYTDGPRVHEYLKEICRDCSFYEKGLLTVGEMSSTSLENCIRYSSPAEKELNMCFNFHHLKADYKDNQKWELQDLDFSMLKDIFHTWQTGMEKHGGWNAVFWCNHDQPRILSRYGNQDKYYLESAKMLGAVIHLMRGTPYIYQGEEIGMTDAGFSDINQYRDVESINYYHILKGQGKKEEDIYDILGRRSRDNGRTPMQWDKSTNGGFSLAQPWIEVNPNYKHINVEDSIKNPDSIFNFYKKLVAMRKEYDVISHGSYEPMLEAHPDVFAYKRVLDSDELIVIANFFEKEAVVQLENDSMAEYDCILYNYGKRSYEKEFKLKPYELCAFYRTARG